MDDMPKIELPAPWRFRNIYSEDARPMTLEAALGRPDRGIWIGASNPELGIDAILRITLDGGRPAVSAVAVTPSGRAIASAALGRIPIEALTASFLASTVSAEENRNAILGPDFDPTEPLPAKRRMTDDFLARVAARYASLEGDHRDRAIAREAGAAPSTVRHWLVEARSRGLLPQVWRGGLRTGGAR